MFLPWLAHEPIAVDHAVDFRRAFDFDPRREFDHGKTWDEVWQFASDNDIDAGRLWGCMSNGGTEPASNSSQPSEGSGFIKFLAGLTKKQKVRYALNKFTEEEKESLAKRGFKLKKIVRALNGEDDDDDDTSDSDTLNIKDVIDKCIRRIKRASRQDLMDKLGVTLADLKNLKDGEMPPGKQFKDWVKNFTGLAGFPTDFKVNDIEDPSKWTFDVADLELDLNSTGMKGLAHALKNTFQPIVPSPRLRTFIVSRLNSSYVEFLKKFGKEDNVESIIEECFSRQNITFICKKIKNFNPFRILHPNVTMAILKAEFSQEIRDRIKAKVPANSKGDKFLNFVKLAKRKGFDFKGLLNLLANKANFTFNVPDLPSADDEYDDDDYSDDDDLPSDNSGQSSTDRRRETGNGAVGGFVETQYKAQATLAAKEQDTKKTDAITTQNNEYKDDLEVSSGSSLRDASMLTGTLITIVALLV